MTSNTPTLRKVLKPVHLWAMAVGLVISGEYFGWNYGWEAGGTVGFLIATFLVTIMYVTFIFSFTELTTAIPEAGGPFAYAQAALGYWGGLVAGYATLVEFLIAPPAIAFALGSYAHFLYPGVSVLQVALTCFVIFGIINFIGIKESAMFALIVTILAVGELLLYVGLVAPHYVHSNFMQDSMPNGWGGVFASLPFAIWFYLAIEGIAMVAEEVKDPNTTIRKGYIYGMFTLVILALAVMVFTGGAGDWHALSTIDHPLPAALAMVMGSSHPLIKVFTSLGLFGLIASFHGTITGYSRQIFALARAGFLPIFLSKVNKPFGTPHWALLVGSLIGCVTLVAGTTDQVIVLAGLGAVVMYVISMAALFVLRVKASGMDRPFKVPFYPLFPVVALVLSLVSLAAIVYYNPKISLLFVLGLLVTLGFFKLKKTFLK